MPDRRIGMWSAAVGVAIEVPYYANGAAWLFSGGLTAPNFVRPPDSFLAIAEMLLLLAAADLVVLMAAVHARAPLDRKTLSLAALSFIVISCRADRQRSLRLVDRAASDPV
jgi:hypothetical protein